MVEGLEAAITWCGFGGRASNLLSILRFNPILQASPADIESDADLSLVDPSIHKLMVCPCSLGDRPAAPEGREQLPQRPRRAVSAKKQAAEQAAGARSRPAQASSSSGAASQPGEPHPMGAAPANPSSVAPVRPREPLPPGTAAKPAVGMSCDTERDREQHEGEEGEEEEREIDEPVEDPDPEEAEEGAEHEEAEDDEAEGDEAEDGEAEDDEAEDGEAEGGEALSCDSDSELSFSPRSGPGDRGSGPGDRGSGPEDRDDAILGSQDTEDGRDPDRIARERDARVADRSRYRDLNRSLSSPPDFDPEDEVNSAPAGPVWNVQVRRQ